MSRKSAIKDWLTAIANKTELEVSQVEDILAKHRIEAMPVASTPKHLLLKRIRFTGTKSLDGVESPIDFHWQNLDASLWAILSNENFRGKSTIKRVADTAVVSFRAVHQTDASFARRGQQQQRLFAMQLFQPFQNAGLASAGSAGEDAETAIVEGRER